MRAISELRTRIRGTIALILLVGLGAGVVISAAAGAKWTQTAYPRFLEESHAADALISVLFVANLVAALPGRMASRMQPAPVLRTE
jgi:hypothetical protein